MSTDYEYEYTPANMCYSGEHKTNFASLNMKTMKAMVSGANPDEVKRVAKGWADLYTQLVGGNAAAGSGGEGGILKIFTSAVDEVLEHWEGEAARRFKAEADKIAKKIRDGAEYARYTSMAMENAGAALADIKPQVEAMEVPDGVDSALDWLGDMGSRSDENLKKELAAGVNTQQALDNNRGDLSAGKEAQLEMAVKMERLGAAYVAQSKAMGTWNRRSRYRDGDDYPGEPGGTPPVPYAVSGGPSAPAPANRGALTPTAQGPGVNSNLVSPEPGIHGGTHTTPNTSQINTGLDGISGGTKTVPNTSPVTPGQSAPPATTAPASNGPTPGPGLVPGGLGRVPNAAAGANQALRAGRMGMPVSGGTGQNAGKGGRGTGRGPLARVPGGVIGANGKSAAKNQGGTGLHRSRGGSMSGGGGKVAGRGMMGVPGNRTAKGEEEERKGKRPDYLVEDEETWTPERDDVAPKVVE